MCDDKDDSFIDEEKFDAESNVETSSSGKSKKERQADARRKLELLREEQELKDQLNDDLYDFPLDDEL
ncbi:PA3496 family putative envelope integrity protein [Pseudomonadota bacterium]